MAVCGELFASTVPFLLDGTPLDEAETPACEGRNPLPLGRGGCQRQFKWSKDRFEQFVMQSVMALSDQSPKPTFLKGEIGE